MKTLYFGGPILTMSDPLYVQAVLVEGGNILAAGSLDRLEAMDAGRRVDLKGSTLLPGFIDPHSHFSQMASACLQVSLEGAGSVEEIAQRIGRFLSETSPSPGSWVAARDYDNNRMPGLADPTLEQLDAMAPGHPLVIHHKSGHMGLMNSAALSALGITPETPVPPGGKIGVKDRCLTGYLEENAFFTYLKQLPPTPPDQLLSAYARAQEQYAAHGITTIQDGMAVEEMFPMYQMLLDSGILKLDLVVYPSPQAYDAAAERFGALPPERHLRIGGMKVYLDGSPQGRTAWMREPYAGEADYRGYGTMEDAALEEAMELAWPAAHPAAVPLQWGRGGGAVPPLPGPGGTEAPRDGPAAAGDHPRAAAGSRPAAPGEGAGSRWCPSSWPKSTTGETSICATSDRSGPAASARPAAPWNWGSPSPFTRTPR